MRRCGKNQKSTRALPTGHTPRFDQGGGRRRGEGIQYLGGTGGRAMVALILARAVWLRIRCADGNNQMAIWGRRCRSLRCYEARRTTAATLASSLSALPPDERGWITFTEARILFSSKGDQYEFGETDDDGKRNIESFAAQHQSVVNFMPIEGRVYFVRDPTA